jgi:drug/metabolite transporter (DMT)-like permease
LVGTTVYQAFFIYGIKRTLTGNASLMLATAPIITTLGEAPTPLQAVGAGGVIAGCLLVRAGKIEPHKPGESGR